MDAGVYPGFPSTLFGGNSVPSTRIRWMVAVSLLFHVAFVVLVSGLRFSRTERPLASYEVSLVTLPTPQVQSSPPAEPERDEPKQVQPPAPVPVQSAKEEKSLPPVHLPPPPEPRPAPKVLTPPPTQALKLKPQPVAPPPPLAAARPVHTPPVTRSVEVPPPAPPPARPALNREVLKGFNLPEVPRLAEVKPPPSGSPKETTNRTEEEVQKLLKNLRVPESVTERPHQLDRVASVPPPPSVSEELNRQLQTLQKQTIIPPPAATPPRPAPSEQAVAAKPVPAKTPNTTLRLPGLTQGNPYLALVQKRISNQWIAPLVSVNDERLQVVVRFRLDRSGRVSDIVIEHTSGNEYYDLAAKRAVLAADPLPRFPADLTQPYLDAHFTFAVGEPVS